MVHADYLFLLTDVEGLYTANPRKDPDAKFLEVVSSVAEARLEGGGLSNYFPHRVTLFVLLLRFIIYALPKFGIMCAFLTRPFHSQHRHAWF